MSELANQERATKQRWAVPGGSHDRVVRFAKIALPSAVGVVIAFLAMAPLDDRSDVSFILDKNQVENAPERMRVEQARYTGEDNRGQKFQITANRALQRTSEQPIVDIWGMMARFGLSQGPVTVAANQGQYNLDQQKAALARSMREEVWPLFAAGKLKPVIHRVFPLSEAAAAHRLMESSAHIGKIMLVVRR